MSTDASLRFLGGVRVVTGSKFLVEAGDARVLVDCGLYQGPKDLRRRNRQPFQVPPGSIDAVVLTHAHLDHSGYVPLLVRDGFAGPVFCTDPTRRLSEIVLPDSGRLQEEEARVARELGYSKHSPPLPLYTERDAATALERFVSVPFAQEQEVAPGIVVTLARAGHILGSSIVTVRVPGGSALFSGDLGRPSHPLLRAPAPPPAADVLVVESTYGDRPARDEDVTDLLAGAIERTAARGGVIVIPAFAVDRTEIVLMHLRRLIDAGRIPRLTVFVDSPMALAALRVYRDAIARADTDEVRPELEPHPFDTGRLVEARTVEESKRIHDVHEPAIIISASGMATGGRVLHHLSRRLPDRRNTIILPGFQVPGTRGHALAQGAKALKIHGRYVPVKAEVVDLSGISAHADAGELLAWTAAMPTEPSAVYIVHGDEAASLALRDRLRDGLGWTAIVPHLNEKVRLAP